MNIPAGTEVLCKDQDDSGPFEGIIRGYYKSNGYAVEVPIKTTHKGERLHNCRTYSRVDETFVPNGRGWWVRPENIEDLYKEMKYDPSQMVDDEEDL